MTIGQLLKQYRIESLKTQKEWAGNTISTSYYSKVEKDQHRITAEDLIALLHANNIKLWEFFGKLSQEDKVKYDENNDIGEAINEAFYHNDKEQLKDIKNVIANSEIVDKEDQLLLIDALIALVGNHVEDLDEKERIKLKEKIFNISNFDENKLDLYCNLMPFYDLDSNLLISRRVITQFCHSGSSNVQETILGIEINMLIMCIEKSRYRETKFFIQAADQISTKPNLFFYKNCIFILKNIVNYHYERKDEYLNKARMAIDHISSLGMPEYSKDMKDILDKYGKN